MSKNKGGFFLAGLIGAIAGAVGGLLLAPQSGKETRKAISLLAISLAKKIQTSVDETEDRVKDIYGKVTDEAKEKYNEVKNTVVSKVAALKTAGESIDREKYFKVVDGVVSELKSVEKVGTYLKKDWEKMKKALA